ncbi:hypothetical protein [Achromobacter arsenitoxydans]|uniref:Uncharacterized protein n=1 Tax=Achromobacter arsenitoxydans SY8 TaxID=477184 RepID=H0F1M7_9BURK|nr:hypothetical protein [Achromobacter arsenitoxydans]EHK67905.1 hypothetical protein KYC_03309 [Achromobacter arsenitoxydans SY8]
MAVNQLRLKLLEQFDGGLQSKSWTEFPLLIILTASAGPTAASSSSSSVAMPETKKAATFRVAAF